MKYLLPLIAILILQSSSAAQNQSYQGEWLDGPGVPGPEPSWLNSFDVSECIAWWAPYPYRSSANTLQLVHYYEKPVDTYAGDITTIRCADIDSDGDIDIAGAFGATGSLKWWQNSNGSGMNWDAFEIEAFPASYDLALADIDGDGHLDIVSASLTGDEVSWWRNTDGTGTQWQKHMVATVIEDARHVEAGDIDGDGDVDLLCAPHSTGFIYWMENQNGSGTSWSIRQVSAAPLFTRAMCLADLNGNGKLDLVTSSSDIKVSWWEFNPISTWARHTVDNVYSAASDVTSGDFNGDGYIDIAGSSDMPSLHKVSLWTNVTGSGTSWYRTTIGGAATNAPGSNSLFPVDYDEDGDLDLVGTSAYWDRACIWDNSDSMGQTWLYHIVDGHFNGGRSACFADLNGDGTGDVAAASLQDGLISWWNDSSYAESGWLLSTIDLNYDETVYTELTGSACTPGGTAVGIQLRSSNTWSDMGPWTDTLTFPCNLNGILEPGRYLQYRAVLTTADPDTTPALSNLTVHWYALGIGEGTPGSTLLTGPVQNPALGEFTVAFQLAEPGIPEFTVYDLSGRSIACAGGVSTPSGSHTVTLGEFPPGVYYVTMEAEGAVQTCRVVCIR